MKNLKFLILALPLLFLVPGCDDDTATPYEEPIFAEVETYTAADITGAGAKLRGTITEVGYPAYFERGFCYSQTKNEPTVDDSKVTASGNGDGDYSAAVTGLVSVTKYYFRAYVINGAGISYGDVIPFTTK